MNHNFCVELGVAGISHAHIIQALRRVGFDVEDERRRWTLVGNAGGGVKVLSPILLGDAGLNKFVSLAAALKKAGATADQRCDFYVRFSSDDNLEAEDAHRLIRHCAAHGMSLRMYQPETLQQLYGMHGVHFSGERRASQRSILEFKRHGATLDGEEIAAWVRAAAAAM